MEKHKLIIYLKIANYIALALFIVNMLIGGDGLLLSNVYRKEIADALRQFSFFVIFAVLYTAWTNGITPLEMGIRKNKAITPRLALILVSIPLILGLVMYFFTIAKK